MQIGYFDALCGSPVPVKGVGHIRSPKIAELRPTTGIGFHRYNIYLNLLSWTKEQVVKFCEVSNIPGADKLAKADRLSVFDVISLLPQTRELYCDVFSFFITEDVEWNDELRCFDIYSVGEEDKRIVGRIIRDNFEDVRVKILQMNYVGLDKQSSPAKHTTETAHEWWEMAQEYLTKQAQEKADAKQENSNSDLSLGNILSKVCAMHPSYNHTNVYELTIFQLYDTFFQIGFLKSAELSERVFSIHGGKKFKFEDWMKSIQK